MNIRELNTLLQRRGLAPLYMITGEEAFLRDEAVKLIRTRAIHTYSASDGPSVEDPAASPLDFAFHYEVLYGDETDADDILLSAREASLFSSGRLMIVKWAEKLPTKTGEALIPYFASPNESTTLVFVGSKFDGRLKWVHALKARAVVVECPPLHAREHAAWIHQQAQRVGVRLDRQALELLKESTGGGLYTVWNELQKIAAYVPEGACATALDVEAVRGREPGTSVFELADAIARGDHVDASRIISTNLESGEAPLRLLGALSWQIRRIRKAKALLATGQKAPDVARMLGIHALRGKAFFEQVRQWNDAQLRLAHDLLWSADSALKGWGASSPQHVFDALLRALCNASSRPGHGSHHSQLSHER